MMQTRMSRRSFLKAGAFTAAAAGLCAAAPAAAAAENCFAPAPSALCETSFGAVRGTDKGDRLVWYGVPYGAAPVGALRWQPPQDPAPWTGERDCTRPSAVAYQYANGVPTGTEDCLKLDVYAPAGARGLPVLVYLHGGNNQTGTTQEIPGDELVVRDGCVFVSVDYRLGLFGFNCLPALRTGADGTGNYTLLDIAHALDWVRGNIRRFGGDPRNITVSGFSAGGRDVMAMLASPYFAGRFDKAIVFSGGMTVADEAAGASQIAWAVAPLAVEDGLFADAGAAHAWLLTDGAEVRSWLYGLDPARLCALMPNANIRMSAFPHLYADGAVLPAEGFAAAGYNSVPLVMLTGSTEFSMFNILDGYYAAAGWDAGTTVAAKRFATAYGSELYRIFNAEASAETLYPRYGAPIYLCQVEYGSAASRSPITSMSLGSFHGIFVPMLSSENAYTAYYDFGGAGYGAMAEQFNLYLRNFLRSGDPNRAASGTLAGLWQSLTGSAGETPPAARWEAWTPDNRVSLVLDGDEAAGTALVECRDVSTDYGAILDRMDADGSVSAEVKLALARNVLNGRWFSAALDERYGNPSLWK